MMLPRKCQDDGEYIINLHKNYILTADTALFSLNLPLLCLRAKKINRVWVLRPPPDILVVKTDDVV